MKKKFYQLKLEIDSLTVFADVKNDVVICRLRASRCSLQQRPDRCSIVLQQFRHSTLPFHSQSD